MKSHFISRLIEVAFLFLKLGTIGFGGPAAHTAMMHNEVVTRRKWMDDQTFLDLLGATQLIPGPNSTEMASHIGFIRAGWLGMIVGGLCFTLPAMCIVIVLSWVYVRYGATPQAEWISYGVKPVVIGIILQAIWSLRKKAVKDTFSALLGVGVIILLLLGVNELVLLFGGAAIFMIVKNKSISKRLNFLALLVPIGGVGTSIATAKVYSLSVLFLTFLKIGSVLYGSGFVLLAYLRADFVVRLGWLTDQQLLDAIAIGQITPGPLFTSATFIGYILGGFKGALLGTLAIFLPSYIFVAIVNPLIPRLRNSAWTGSLLDGVNIASLGLMAGVTIEIARSSLTDMLTCLIAGLSVFILTRYKINATWLILGGVLVGLFKSLSGY
jgi:chromate transporter